MTKIILTKSANPVDDKWVASGMITTITENHTVTDYNLAPSVQKFDTEKSAKNYVETLARQQHPELFKS